MKYDERERAVIFSVSHDIFIVNMTHLPLMSVQGLAGGLCTALMKSQRKRDGCARVNKNRMDGRRENEWLVLAAYPKQIKSSSKILSHIFFFLSWFSTSLMDCIQQKFIYMNLILLRWINISVNISWPAPFLFYFILLFVNNINILIIFSILD